LERHAIECTDDARRVGSVVHHDERNADARTIRRTLHADAGDGRDGGDAYFEQAEVGPTVPTTPP
jgi:hypothetical protein